MSHGKPDRRQVLRGGAALLGTTALAGCAQAGGLDPALDRVRPGAEGEPARGGVLRFGLSTDPSNFHPHISAGSASDTVVQLVYNGLLAFDADGEIVGDLAREFGWDTDTRYEVTLHSEVYFHDGSRLTAADVVHSFELMLDPDNGTTTGPLLAGVEKVSAPSADTVLFELAEPNATLPFALASRSANVVSRAWWEGGADPRTSMMGTGPFTFVERIPGVSLTFERFDRYFVPELPYLNGIQFTPMIDDYARVTALRSATVDMIDYVPATHLDVVRRNPRLDLVSDTTFGFGCIGFVTDRPPFDDVRVRKAVALSIDRKAILDTAFLGNGEPMTGGLTAPSVADYANDLEGTYEYDPDQAAHLLKKAGVRGLDLSMVTTSSYSVISRPAEAALQSLRTAGVDVSLERQEWLTFRDTVQARTFPSFSWGTAPAYGDPDAMRDFVGTGGVWADYLKFSDDKVDGLLAEGRRTRDRGLREELYHKAEERVLDLCPWVLTVRREQGEAFHTYVRGFFHPPKGAWTLIALRQTWLEER
ncbi:peptide/nickel transport system substrate-binding protein [Murinocardiopsis flavida]|uniref:Peptide/nickel transport system substrate-binding protein n=1 Tax=Murinocardiopsis flavida TaxID=645275 RepID=A0A2P8DSV2_9ACTN|nr:ABC transporter substrate-binding protein [Murinocardiopsis flavida]PSL00299.1 peptide/nickel transport system substrate-binding protein [Murinocardiopsis flavida]